MRRNWHRSRVSSVVALALTLLLAALVGPAAASAKVSRGFFGIQSWDLSPFHVTHKTTRELGRMQKAGVGLVRMNIFPGVPVNAADAFVLAAARHRIKVMPDLVDGRWNPRQGRTHGLTPPRSFRRLARYAGAVARRYGPHGALWRRHRRLRRYAIRTWQIWNEPNLPVYWLPRPNPRAYARAVRTVGRAIRRVDRKAAIVTAGLPDSKQSRPLRVRTYLARFLRAGGWRSVRAVGVSAYTPTVGGLRRLLRSYRRLMNAHHGRRLGILITEIGWADRGHRNPMVVGARAQAGNIRRAYRMIAGLRHRWRILGVFYFQWRDVPVRRGDFHGDTWGYHTGLRRVNGRPKRAFEAFTDVLRRLER